MQKKLGIHCYISGRVHGVFFRAQTKKKAQSLNITGWVRNLDDGRVEVFAFGDREKVDELKDWLKHGPPYAQVDVADCTEVDWEDYAGFDVF